MAVLLNCRLCWNLSAPEPVAVLKLPVVLNLSAPEPVAVLPLPVVLSLERSSTGGRVVSAGGEAKESVVSLSGVEAGIASVWWRGNRLRRRRKRKPGEGEGEGDEKETEPQRRAAD